MIITEAWTHRRICKDCLHESNVCNAKDRHSYWALLGQKEVGLAVTHSVPMALPLVYEPVVDLRRCETSFVSHPLLDFFLSMHRKTHIMVD